MHDKYNRDSMIYDLFTNYLQIGMSKDCVIDIIGEPDKFTDTNEVKPFGVMWDKSKFIDQSDIPTIKKDSLLYSYYTTCNPDGMIHIDRYTIGFNGSGPDYMLIIYDWSNRLVDYSFEKSEY